MIVGLRAHDFALAADSPYPARLKVLEVIGEASLLHVQLNGRVDLQPGDSPHLAINPDKIHLFDAQSGARLV